MANIHENDYASRGFGSLWKSTCVDILINEWDFKPWDALNAVEFTFFTKLYYEGCTAYEAVTLYIEGLTS